MAKNNFNDVNYMIGAVPVLSVTRFDDNKNNDNNNNNIIGAVTDNNNNSNNNTSSNNKPPEQVKALYDSALRAQSAGQTAEANKFKALLEAEIQGGSMYVDIAKGRYDASNKMFDAATKAGGEATKSLIEINKAIEDRKAKVRT